jgi:hypothetical protein
MIPGSDFSFYWTAAHQLLAGHNPYVFPPGRPFIMFAPPWVFPVLLGVGALPLKAAESVWSVVLILALATCMSWLWQLYAPGRNGLWAALLTCTFSPVFVTFLLGQTTPLVLLGSAGFLRYESKRPYLAGCFLFLVALKPQIAFLLWPALLLCALLQHRWKPLAGFFAALSAASLLAFVVRATVFQEYWNMLRARQVAFYDTPTIGTFLRHASGFAWMQYLPVLAAILWLIMRWKTTQPWDWKRELPTLLAVSLATAPYAWYSDELILIPAVFYGATMLSRSLGRILAAAAIYLSISFAGLSFVTNRKPAWYTWIPVLWLLLYAAIAQGRPRDATQSTGGLPADDAPRPELAPD